MEMSSFAAQMRAHFQIPGFYAFFFAAIVHLTSCSSSQLPPEIVQIEISREDLEDLEALRQDALKRNDFNDAKEWFKAQVIDNDDTLDAKIRMKGDQRDHYYRSRYSIRIKQRKKGGQVFSVQAPETRRFVAEWIFHQMLKREGIPHLDYRFVTVQVNDMIKGVYAREQHFSDGNIHQQWGLPVGPILGFDDDAFWAGGVDNVTRDSLFDRQAYLKSDLHFYRKSDSITNSLAHQKLDLYRNDELPADSVFNLQLLAKYYAICDLCGARHALRWLNSRYYFHPSEQRFYPIGFDSNSGGLGDLMIEESYLNPVHHEHIIQDSTFQNLYYQEVLRIANTDYLDSFFNQHANELDEIGVWLSASDEVDLSETMAMYYRNQERIRKNLSE